MFVHPPHDFTLACMGLMENGTVRARNSNSVLRVMNSPSCFGFRSDVRALVAWRSVGFESGEVNGNFEVLAGLYAC